MSCQFCGNEKVETYGNCDCKAAVKFKSSTLKKGNIKEARAFLKNCPKCGMMLMETDIKQLFITPQGYKQRVECPSCGWNDPSEEIHII